MSLLLSNGVAAALVFSAIGAPAQGLAERHLAPMAFLAGSCWQGTFAGRSETDTHCFDAMFGGRFLRDRHAVAGAAAPYAGENVYRWDPRAQTLAYDYFASDGGHSEGTVAADGRTLRFSDNYVGVDGKPMVLRSVWTIENSNEFSAKAERLDGGKWLEMWTIRFTRKSGDDQPR